MRDGSLGTPRKQTIADALFVRSPGTACSRQASGQTASNTRNARTLCSTGCASRQLQIRLLRSNTRFIHFVMWLYPGMRCCMLGFVLSPGVCCVGVGDKAQESLKYNSLWGLNSRPMVHKTIALTTELRELISHHPKGHIMRPCCKPEPRATM